MLMGEALSIVEAYQESKRDGWEQARFIAHSVYQIMSKEPLKLSDICAFDWDEEKPKEEKPLRDAAWKEAFDQAKRIQSALNK